MCGIVGFVTKADTDHDFHSLIDNMALTLGHRGPDASGSWHDTDAGCALGHRRLSIIDLSEHGAQPMTSHDGRYMLTFNGEIYNYQAIRASLEKSKQIAFRGTSDTEVMLAAFTEWGVVAALSEFVGMFAFGLWDRQEHVLYLARDRMGEKPLYYGWVGKTFVFGSELKALKAHPDWQQSVNRDALAAFLRYNYVPTSLSIYTGIYKLPPGTYLKMKTWSAETLPEPNCYWSAAERFQDGLSNPRNISEADAIDELERLLSEAVGSQMVSDVPLGAFLSGGVDSSTIVALMQKHSRTPVKTFSIGFDVPEYDEAPYAAAVSRHIGTEHTQQYVTAQDALNVIPLLPTMYDEPFSDMSQIPTYLVSRMARQHVTVSLSGDAGDELFMGYQRYFDALSSYQQLHRLPMLTQQMIGGIIKMVPPKILRHGIRASQGFLPDNFRQHDVVDKLLRMADMLPVRETDAFYLRVMSHWQNPQHMVLGSKESIVHKPQFPATVVDDQLIQHFAGFDLTSYLLDDVLVKVDRASMFTSLESRIPFLNHRVVEYVLRLPFSIKFKSQDPKWLLKQVLHRYVPKSLVDRPKMGFGVPMGQWLREDLRDWAEALLEPKRLADEGFFNPAPIRKLWDSHINNQANWHYHLWDILVFQAWLEDA